MDHQDYDLNMNTGYFCTVALDRMSIPCGSYILLPLGTDIILWHGKTGKILGHVDTNQLKNTMAALSPNGRFLAAAAFTADVKVIIYKFSIG